MIKSIIIPTDKILKFSAILVSIITLSIFILRIVLAQSSQTDLGGVEQNVIYSIQKILYDGKIYTDPTFAPFAITQYTPIYHYLCALLGKVFSLDPGIDIYKIYLIGRYLNVFFNILLAIVVFQVCARNLKISKELSVITSLASFICVFRQECTVRPDSLMDLLLIVTVWAIILFQNKKNVYFLIVAAILSIVVIFVKQSGVQMPVIILGFLVFSKDWKSLAIAFITISISILVCVTVVFLQFGPIFFTNVIGGVANGVDPEWFFLYVFGLGFKIKIMIPALAVLWITFHHWNLFKSDQTTRLLSFTACSMFAFASLTVLKSGSNVSYYYPFFVVSIILISWRIHRYQATNRPFVFASYTLYLTCICFLTFIHQFREVRQLQERNNPGIDQKDLLIEDVSSYLQENLKADDYIFANLDDESITPSVFGRRGINNILFKHALIPQLDIFKSSNVRSKVLGYENFGNMLRNGKVRYIVESDPELDFLIIPDLRKIIKEKYSIVKVFGGYRIYEFRN